MLQSLIAAIGTMLTLIGAVTMTATDGGGNGIDANGLTLPISAVAVIVAGAGTATFAIAAAFLSIKFDISNIKKTLHGLTCIKKGACDWTRDEGSKT